MCILALAGRKAECARHTAAGHADETMRYGTKQDILAPLSPPAPILTNNAAGSASAQISQPPAALPRHGAPTKAISTLSPTCEGPTRAQPELGAQAQTDARRSCRPAQRACAYLAARAETAGARLRRCYARQPRVSWTRLRLRTAGALRGAAEEPARCTRLEGRVRVASRYRWLPRVREREDARPCHSSARHVSGSHSPRFPVSIVRRRRQTRAPSRRRRGSCSARAAGAQEQRRR